MTESDIGLKSYSSRWLCKERVENYVGDNTDYCDKGVSAEHMLSTCRRKRSLSSPIRSSRDGIGSDDVGSRSSTVSSASNYLCNEREGFWKEHASNADDVVEADQTATPEDEEVAAL